MSANRIDVVVRSSDLIAREVRRIELVRADGLPLPAYAPGSHVDVHLGAGLVRQYSLCGDASDAAAYTIAVKLEPASRGGSRAVHELRPGIALQISAPRNNFPLDEDAPHSVLVAGGIGITPILSMARTLARAGRDFTLHYFAQSREHAAFADLLQSPAFAARTHFHLGLERDEVNATLRDALAGQRPGGQLYLCGPRPFMDTVRDTASAQEWPDKSVHLEYFGAVEPQSACGESPIHITLARAGRNIDVPPGKTIVDALRASGIDVDTSCEQGVCGTCVTRVLDGVPEHRDLFLTDAEKSCGDCMAICVSRALTRHLVLDL
jgi:vanillate O-demethylase ferredoxin subunit